MSSTSGSWSLRAPPRSWRLAAVALLPLAAVGWWLSVGRMGGMDAGPGTSLGTFGWFATTWVVMMAAMMVPAITPAVASSFSPASRQSLHRTLAATGFVVGYLVVWALAGAAAYAALRVGRSLVGGTFAWHRAGQWLSVAVVAGAAAYQLSPTKGRWLARCRAEFIGSAAGLVDGARSGLAAGGRCLASSWALMVVLFALGVMSLVWMAVVAVLIATERLAPLMWPARIATAGVLLAIAVGVALAPVSVPGLIVPGSPAAHQAMMQMSGMAAPARPHMPMAPARGHRPMHGMSP